MVEVEEEEDMNMVMQAEFLEEAGKQISSLWGEDSMGENTRSVPRMVAAEVKGQLLLVVVVVVSSSEVKAIGLLEPLKGIATRVCQCTYQATDLLLAVSAESP